MSSISDTSYLTPKPCVIVRVLQRSPVREIRTPGSARGLSGNRQFYLNVIFRAADEDGALESANFLGQKRVIKKTWGFAQGRKTYHYSEQEEHKLKPHELRGLAKHTCILVHAERGFRQTLIRPIERDGSVCSWF